MISYFVSTESIVTFNILPTYSLTLPPLLDLFNGNVKNLFMKTFFTSLWGKRRNLPTFSKYSFSKQNKKH